MISTSTETLLRRRTLGVLAGLALLLAGCGTRTASTDSFLGLITPYRIDIVQGNAVTREQVALIKPGMSREQVLAVLGTPMLIDPFHADRWDYLFSLRRPGTAVQRRVVVAHFKGPALERLEAPDDLPTEAEFVASIVPVRRAATPPVLELSDEQRQALVRPAPRKAEDEAQPLGPARTYPPLEPR